MLARRFADIMAVEEVEVRLDRISGNGCWRFHADYVTARLITTYVGRGTEWLDGSMAAAHLAGEAVVPHRLDAGTVGLFKGREWADDRAIIHRSPPIAETGETRLLLVIDAVRQND